MSLAAKQGDAGGLDLAGLGDLAALLDGPESNAGEPKLYDVDIIHEDKDNRRWEDNPGFSTESIEELAASYARREAQGKRGIKSPISLRPHPTIPGHFIINHGHRRFRAAKVFGMRQVPAFEDRDFDDIDQVVENVQRENHTAREIADFIAHKVALGMSQAELARALGKSKAWVSQHAAMHSLPEPVAEAVAAGKVTDVTLANELAVAHREDPQAVTDLLNATDTKPTRSAVKSIRKAVEAKRASPAASPQAPGDDDSAANGAPAPGRASAAEPASSTFASAVREVSAEAKAEFQRYRYRLEQDRKDAANPTLRKKGTDALARLIKLAMRDTGQSRRVASFLLAWWNATSCGGFDLADFWSVDAEIADDMLLVIGLIRQTRAYPDTLGTEIHGQFKAMVALWRPDLSDA
ncbi:ParB/RepB/Spo0J family partition protein [Achromobacter sp. SLBN-14]|uniref:DUF7673 family protein n=1 Tax=Achromobacter sp. SLBN-14 TaxID=2768442 RepID=UPI00114EB51C|nr:ParB/RepB/Spo0J family partition protein [Achromobacter sp. SLBN-14]TQJ94710.1 ParB/RepB/Spo0J family partition protein [Achromobacter sp. SLBN-14]